ncbi:MAG: NAD(P)-dependent oxidoreductase [Alphaproteobacteria bacterium]
MNLRPPPRERKRQFGYLSAKLRMAVSGGRMSQPTIGIIGLGTMGGAICRHVIKAGFPVTVWARSKERAAAHLDDGAGWSDTAGDLASGTDIVVLCVSNDAAVEEVVFGPTGIAAGEISGKILIDHSTIHPEATRDWAARLRNETGMGWIDAPVSGGPGGAERGELIAMAGGDAGEYDSARPVMESYTKKTTLMGPVGAGQATKVCNQLIIGAEICAIAEALNFAARFGMDAPALADALQGGWADSPVLQDHGRRMANADYSDPADASMMMKDMDIACDMGHRTGSPMPVSEVVQALFRRAIEQGHMDGGQIAPMRLYSDKPL